MQVACCVLYFLLLSSSAEGNTEVNTCSNEECADREVEDDTMLLQTAVNIHDGSDRAGGSDLKAYSQLKENHATDVGTLTEAHTGIEAKVSQDEMLADFMALATKWKSFQETEEPDEIFSKVVSKSVEDIAQSMLDRQSHDQELDVHDDKLGLLEHALTKKPTELNQDFCMCSVYVRQSSFHPVHGRSGPNPNQWGYKCDYHGSGFKWCYTCVAGNGKDGYGCNYGTPSNPAGKKWTRCHTHGNSVSGLCHR